MQNEIKNIVGHKALINSGKMKIVLTEWNISSAWILAGGTCERKGNFDCRVIRCHYLLMFLNAGQFQTCFTGAFDISSRVGIFAKHTRISGKIWYDTVFWFYMYIVKAALDLKSLTHDAWGLEQLEHLSPNCIYHWALCFNWICIKLNIFLCPNERCMNIYSNPLFDFILK